METALQWVGEPSAHQAGGGARAKLLSRASGDPRTTCSRCREAELSEAQGSLISLCRKALEPLFWTWGPLPGGREARPSPQGRRLAPRSLRPHLEHAQVASGCVGRGSAGGWDGGETAAEELGRLGFRLHPPGGAAPACPPRGRSRCRPAHRTKPPAPTPPGPSAPVLPGHGRPQSLPPDGSASVPAPSGLSLPRPCLSLLCSLCQSP